MTMQSVKLDISSDIFDKVLSFLEMLPKQKVHITINNLQKNQSKHKSLSEFFQSSPLVGLDITRSKESYKARIEF